MKWYVVAAIVLVALALVAFAYLREPSKLIQLQVPQLSQINSVQNLGGGRLLLGGVVIDGSQSIGLAGIYYVSNHSFVPLPVSIPNGSIYDVSFNGSTYMIAGAQYTNSSLNSRVFLLSAGKLINLTSLLPSFYQVGQAYFAEPYGEGWLIGGTAFTFGFNQRGLQYPFLLIYNGTLVDLTPKLPEPFRPLGAADTLDALSTSGEEFLVGGGNINATLATFDGNFVNISLGFPGVILASAATPGGWMVGGVKFGNQGGSLVLYTYLATVNSSGVEPVKLTYELGFVTALGYGQGTYAVALRVPFNSPTSSPREGAVLLVGHSLTRMRTVFTAVNSSITDVQVSGGTVYASGYSTQTGTRTAFLLIYP
ncbi:hypothetical protein HS1genome_1504 [Sulfodiicoccus acidiphilus]|uniref:Uncharacterized protein n=1 Tax=Sulfodiicoccus acidiphilus TaxID=1670455 RepID=A0A348B4L3_9CREN|nr:hypothetical protein [Sulfodiicoccus acidiphilus]BBD73115.1 hypothetical protein HS1genome_1504 [Sulfodiicoccus acidiphilus]GGU00683.1 hypothetical protein GCM10007116_17420 [Sulfodiicoccus acidiphilus]